MKKLYSLIAYCKGRSYLKTGILICSVLVLVTIGIGYRKLILKSAVTTTSIDNTATATYKDGSGQIFTVNSNTVSINIESQQGNLQIQYRLDKIAQGANHSTNLTLNVYQPGTTNRVINEISASGDANGNATVNLTLGNGTYDFVIKAPLYLSSRKANVNYSGSLLTLDFGALKGGDLSGNNVIAGEDFSILKSHWLETSSNYDINRDGQVNIIDFAIMSLNWMAQGG